MFQSTLNDFPQLDTDLKWVTICTGRLFQFSRITIQLFGYVSKDSSSLLRLVQPILIIKTISDHTFAACFGAP
jgi:hypothetical protein